MFIYDQVINLCFYLGFIYDHICSEYKLTSAQDFLYEIRYYHRYIRSDMFICYQAMNPFPTYGFYICSYIISDMIIYIQIINLHICKTFYLITDLIFSYVIGL